MEDNYSNGDSTIRFYENKFGQVLIEVDGKWISIPYDQAIKIGQRIVECGEEIENRNHED